MDEKIRRRQDNLDISGSNDPQPATEPMSVVPRRRKIRSGLLVTSAILLLVALIFAYPMIELLVAPTATHTNMTTFAGIGYGKLSHVLFAWRQIMGFDQGLFLVWLANTLIMVGGGTIGTIILSIPAGYAMARLRFRGRGILLFITLLLMVMPSTVLVIPLFLEVSMVHLLDSYWPVIIIFSFFPFGVYLAYIHFKTALPIELIEAGRMDGLSEFGIFQKIALPLAKQAVALVGFFAFVAAWTNFFLPYVLIPDTHKSPLAVGLLMLISSSQIMNPELGMPINLYMAELALAAVINMLPVLVLFVAAQRYLQQGAMMGAIKE